jgi:fluoride ion exporter CrcB/FEX
MHGIAITVVAVLLRVGIHAARAKSACNAQLRDGAIAAYSTFSAFASLSNSLLA